MRQEKIGIIGIMDIIKTAEKPVSTYFDPRVDWQAGATNPFRESIEANKQQSEGSFFKDWGNV